MNGFRRDRFLVFAAAIVLLAMSGQGVWSQATRTIKIVVPYTPGSGPDILSRLLAEQIGRTQGPTVVVENRPGGGTLIGTEAAARSAPDGNTVLLAAPGFVVNPALKPQSYDPSTSFDPICNLASTPIIFVVKGDSPYRSLDDFIAAARAKPGELSVASGGPATSLHITHEVIKRAANLNLTYVPYGGTAPAINALLGGHVQAVVADFPTVAGQLKSGTLRPLVTASGTRVAPLPDVPTLIETGLTKYETDIFYGLVAPAKTPPEALSQLSGWFDTAVRAPELKPKLDQLGLFVVGTCGAAFGSYLRKQVEDYSRVIREAGIQVQ